MTGVAEVAQRWIPAVALFLSFPAAAAWAGARWRWARAVGPVTICYVAGMLVANQPLWKPDPGVTDTVASVGIALAIPLVVFSMDIVAWLRMAGATVRAFAAAVAGVVVAGAVTVVAYGQAAPRGPDMAGMLAGVYAGGTANMAAIGVALGVPSETFVALNAADLLWSALYVLLVFSVGPRLVARFLAPFPGDRTLGAAGGEGGPVRLRHRVAGLALAAVVSAAGLAARALAPPGFEMSVAMLALTTLAVAASLVPAVRRLPGTWGTGHYVLLVFCFSTGAMADFARVFEGSLDLVAFCALQIWVTVALQFAFGALFRVDRDTMLVASAATIMNPAFVTPVAESIGNRAVVLPGIASGIVGFALANYVGIFLAWVLA
ncbi:MAG: DUF819 family protein [Deltaproteobacteria bacterium]|nr:DUF819 family protein [Deltaproteobacteria bacterium]